MKLWRGQPDNWTWTPSRVDKGRLWLGFAGVFYVLGILALTSPSSSPATGRWAWLHNLSAKVFGPSGDIFLYAILGTICLVASLHNFRAPK